MEFCIIMKKHTMEAYMIMKTRRAESCISISKRITDFMKTYWNHGYHEKRKMEVCMIIKNPYGEFCIVMNTRIVESCITMEKRTTESCIIMSKRVMESCIIMEMHNGILQYHGNAHNGILHYQRRM